MRGEKGDGNKNLVYFLLVSLLFNVSNIWTLGSLHEGTVKMQWPHRWLIKGNIKENQMPSRCQLHMWSVHVLGELVTMERVPGAVGITGSKEFNTGLDFVLPLVSYMCPEDNFGGYSVLFCHTTIKSFLQILAKGWFDTWSRILMNQLGPWKTYLYVYLPTPCFTSKTAHR